MSRPAPELTADSTIGRVLIALRAGPMHRSELAERLGHLPSMAGLIKKGWVVESDSGYQLTEAGRAVCPLRNPLAGNVTKAPAGAQSARPVMQAAARTFSPRPEPTTRPVTLPPTGDNSMQQLPVIPEKADKPHVDQIRRLLIDSPQGIARKDLIKCTGLPDASVDNAIVNLIKGGEATRKSYGVIAPIADGIKRLERAVAAPAVSAAVAPVDPVSPAAADPDIDADTPEIDFAIHADGRLEIINGDAILVLPPVATRRLGYFLGCLEIEAWPPRLDPETVQLQTTA